MTLLNFNTDSIFKGSCQRPYDLQQDFYSSHNENPFIIHAHYWNFKAARAALYYLSSLDKISDALNHVHPESRIDIVLSLAETIENIFDEQEINKDMTDRNSIARYIERAKKNPYDLMHVSRSEDDDSEIINPESEIPNFDKAEYIAARAIIENLQSLRLQIIDFMEREEIKTIFESLSKDERVSLIERLAKLIKDSHLLWGMETKWPCRF